MKAGKGSKYHSGYWSFRIWSYMYAGRPWFWLYRKRGRHITKSPPSFQYEKCLFGYHTTFSPNFLSGNACHHVLYYRILVHLAPLNSAVRQLLVSFRSFWCSIFVFVLLLLLLERSKCVKEAISSPDLPCQHLYIRKNFVRVVSKKKSMDWSERRGMIIRVHDSIR